MRGWDGTENRGRSSEKKLKKPRISNSRSHDRVVYDVYLQTQSAQPLRTPYTKVMGQHSRKCQNHMEKRWGILTASTSAATAAASRFRLLTIDRKDISCLRRASARMLLRRVQPRIVRSCEWYLLMTIVKVVLETKRNENESPPFEKKKNIREKLLKWLAVHSQGLCIGADWSTFGLHSGCLFSGQSRACQFQFYSSSLAILSFSSFWYFQEDVRLFLVSLPSGISRVSTPE